MSLLSGKSIGDFLLESCNQAKGWLAYDVDTVMSIRTLTRSRTAVKEL